MIRGLVRASGIAVLTAMLTAHVGSPDVYFSGRAGPYEVDVLVKPPQVVPGIADVLVRSKDTTVSRVAIRPVFWRAGTHGAPPADEAGKVRGTPGTFSGKLWLMSSGSSGVDVQVSGTRGTGSVLVPVAAVATGQLALTPLLKILLAILGGLLVAGAITAGYLAAGESQVAPGEEMPAQRRSSARKGALIATVLLAAIVFGGARWWSAEADDYRRTLYKPVPTITALSTTGTPTITMSITDSLWREGGITPVMPDHGKLAHMFVIGSDSPFVFVHLHPSMPDGSTFVSALPPLPAGRYRVFTDVVHESGFERTMPDSVRITSVLDSSGLQKLDADDSWSENVPQPVSSNIRGLSGHEGGMYLQWAVSTPIKARQPDVIRIRVTGKKGEPIEIEPFLGMAGHAVVLRNDGKVFVHLHPGGTSSMASQTAFAMRDRGDTTQRGRLDSTKFAMQMSSSPMDVKEIAFPYAFPEPGAYTVWVQVKFQGRVHTTGYNVSVLPAS